MAATVSTSANWSVVENLSPRNSATAIIKTTSTTAITIRQSPIFKTAFWKWLTVWGRLDQLRSLAELGAFARRRYYCINVAFFQNGAGVNRLAGLFSTGSDSLVSAD